MSNFNCAYVREHYGVPAEIGRRVIANSEPGVIMADRGHYIGIILDSDPKVLRSATAMLTFKVRSAA